MTTVNPADPTGGLPAEPFDVQDALPVWRQLANERLMFPLDMDIVAAKIGPERQLFVDNALIARVSNVTREVHQPVRYAGNPVFEAAGNRLARLCAESAALRRVAILPHVVLVNLRLARLGAGERNPVLG